MTIVLKGEALRLALEELREKETKLIQDAQLNCTHPDIVEIAYEAPSWSGTSQPPFRVCVDCGFAEEGWHCGYQILRGEARRVSRDEGYCMRLGPIHENRLFVRVGDCNDRKELYRDAVTKETK